MLEEGKEDVVDTVVPGTTYPMYTSRGSSHPDTFIDEKTNKSITVCVEKELVDPVRAGKITINHLLGFTVLRGDNDGLYFIAPKVRAMGEVDSIEVESLEAVTFNQLAGY